MDRSENRPLPELPPNLWHRISAAQAKAQARLNDDLHDCWVRCFPVADTAKNLRAPEPQHFFKPFVAYGVALYDAFARTLLKLMPDLSDYLDWIDYAVKT